MGLCTENPNKKREVKNFSINPQTPKWTWAYNKYIQHIDMMI